MPNTVSEAVDKLSDIIESEDALQNIWVHGRISSTHADVFFNIKDLEDPDNVDNQIQCLIRAPHALNVPSVDAEVFVKGSVILLRDRGEYRFSVTDIEAETPRADMGNQPVSVSDLTRTLKNSIRAHSVTVQGKIHEPPKSMNDFILLVLKNADPNRDNARDVIECTLRPDIARAFSSEQGDRVSVEGKFTIFPPMSRYQIGASNTPCVLHIDEAQVVREVKSYFSELRQEFSIATECEIQMGVSHRSADVVLIDSERSFTAIAECKGSNNVTDNGIKQLKSYLCATDTRFGVFANSTNPDTWVFYENLRHNRFRQIERPEFETRVVQRPMTQHVFQDKIRSLEAECEHLKSEICRLKRKETAWNERIQQFERLLNSLKNDPSD